MTEEEALKSLRLRGEGLLHPDKARELDAALAASPKLQAEFCKLKEENELLTEALAPLRPSQSARLRIVEAMQLAATDMHRRARYVAETLPERGWRIFRLAFASLALVVAALLGHYRPLPPLLPAERRVGYFVILGLFALGIIFLVAGNMLAHLEARLLGLVYQRDVEPSRLEILVLEVFGIFSLLAAGVMYLLA